MGIGAPQRGHGPRNIRTPFPLRQGLHHRGLPVRPKFAFRKSAVGIMKALAPATKEPPLPSWEPYLVPQIRLSHLRDAHRTLAVPETRDFEIDLTVIQALEDGNVIGTPQHVATVIAAALVPPLLSLHQGLGWGSRPDRAAASP